MPNPLPVLRSITALFALSAPWWTFLPRSLRRLHHPSPRWESSLLRPLCFCNALLAFICYSFWVVEKDSSLFMDRIFCPSKCQNNTSRLPVFRSFSAGQASVAFLFAVQAARIYQQDRQTRCTISHPRPSVDKRHVPVPSERGIIFPETTFTFYTAKPVVEIKAESTRFVRSNIERSIIFLHGGGNRGFYF